MRRASHRLLIVGCGSAGKRHIRNFQQLGAQVIAAVDSREDRLEEVSRKYRVPHVYEKLTGDVWQSGCDAAVICSPPAFHVPQAMEAARHGLHLMIEKPLSHRLKGVDDLVRTVASAKLVALVAFSYRFWPPFRKAKDLIQKGSLGAVRYIRVEVGQYLPDWHPWEDYRSWFMARKDMGGGIMLDEVHFIDSVRWLVGEIVQVLCIDRKLSTLEIDSDDIAEISGVTESGAVYSIHADMISRFAHRSLEVVGEEGSLIWDDVSNELRLFRASKGRWRTFRFSCERNVMFLEEARHFLACLEGKAAPTVTLGEGRRNLEVALAARRSSDEGRLVELANST